jgi:hypothetical protein
MAIKFNNIFYSKALQILPKLVFFGLKTNHLATLVARTNDGGSNYSLSKR